MPFNWSTIMTRMFGLRITVSLIRFIMFNRAGGLFYNPLKTLSVFVMVLPDADQVISGFGALFDSRREDGSWMWAGHPSGHSFSV